MPRGWDQGNKEQSSGKAEVLTQTITQKIPQVFLCTSAIQTNKQINKTQ